MKQSLSRAEHAKLIEERRCVSPVWQAVHVFGSLKLAVFLLITIATACAVATFAESRMSFKVAQYYIYNAPWFTFWLLLLGVNIVAAAATRWPWQDRHYGFVVTHAGLIVMLIGSMIGRAVGFEGSLTLFKGDQPTRMLIIDQPVVVMESPASGLMYQTPVSVAVRPPAPDRVRRVDVPHSRMKIELSGYSDALDVRPELVADAQGTPGVRLRLHSAMMNQTLDIPMAHAPVEARGHDLFGRARIEWTEQLPEAAAVTDGEAPTFRETQMILARMPDAPIISNTSGQPSGYRFLLEPVEETGEFRIVIMDPDGGRQSHPLRDVLDKDLPGSEPGTQIFVVGYWPDLRMVDGRPATASSRPNNPAVLVTLAGFIDMLGGSTPELRMAPGKDARVDYQVLRGGRMVGEGSLAVGESFQPGWADWSISLEDFQERARLATRVEHLESGGENSISGILARLVDAEGNAGEKTWIASGTSRILENGSNALRVGFGLQTMPMDFTVQLMDFEVPRDEGTTTPANYISSVRFDGDHGTREAVIEMNHPASYPPGWWGALTGWNHKFSQAGWDPNDLDQTSLQVLYDPGWLFKWVGSILICAGMFIMFYLKPRNGGRPSDMNGKETTQAHEETRMETNEN